MLNQEPTLVFQGNFVDLDHFFPAGDFALDQARKRVRVTHLDIEAKSFELLLGRQRLPASAKALCRRVTRSAGVLLGARNAYQSLELTCGSPTSVMVGVFGRSSRRRSAVVAMSTTSFDAGIGRGIGDGENAEVHMSADERLGDFRIAFEGNMRGLPLDFVHQEEG